MAVSSTMTPLGSTAPSFALTDATTGDTVTLAQVRGDVATVVMFICNHCPYVKHVNPQLVAVASDYAAKGVGFVAISANDPDSHPEDAPDKMAEVAATELPVAGPDWTVGQALRQMVDANVDHLPVTDGEGRLRGMVTSDAIVDRNDLLERLSASRDARREHGI